MVRIHPPQCEVPHGLTRAGLFRSSNPRRSFAVVSHWRVGRDVLPTKPAHRANSTSRCLDHDQRELETHCARARFVFASAASVSIAPSTARKRSCVAPAAWGSSPSEARTRGAGSPRGATIAGRESLGNTNAVTSRTRRPSRRARGWQRRGQPRGGTILYDGDDVAPSFEARNVPSRNASVSQVAQAS